MMIMGLLPLLFLFLLFRVPSALRERGMSEEHSGNQGFVHRSRGNASLESSIYRLAGRLRGRVTLSVVVIETGLSLKEAEEVLDSMIDGLRVQIGFNENGLTVYDFPEIAARTGPGLPDTSGAAKPR